MLGEDPPFQGEGLGVWDFQLLLLGSSALLESWICWGRATWPSFLKARGEAFMAWPQGAMLSSIPKQHSRNTAGGCPHVRTVCIIWGEDCVLVGMMKGQRRGQRGQEEAVPGGKRKQKGRSWVSGQEEEGLVRGSGMECGWGGHRCLCVYVHV